jgi:hypothetical protein
MHYSACLTLLALTVAGCAAEGQQGTGLQARAEAAPYSREVTDGFRPGERIEHKVLHLTKPHLQKARHGHGPDGQEYRYYDDGSGSVRDVGASVSDGWEVNCPIDSMADRRKCSIKNRALFISFGFGSSPLGLCIREHDFPGRTGLIRIDDAAPIPTDRSGCVEGAAIVNRAAAAQRIRFRFVHWPYDHNRNGEVSARGLKAAILLVGHMRSKLGSLSFD